MRNSLERIAAIAANTIRESLRNRVLYALLAATALAMIGSLLLSFATVETESRIKVIIDFGLSSISVFGMVAAIFLGTNLIYQEIDKRTIYTLLARPLTRPEFILGKYLGLVGVNALCIAATGTFFIAFLLLNGGALSLTILAALLTTFLQLTVVTGLALVLSVTAHPVEGAVFALIITIAGLCTESLQLLARQIIEREGASIGLLSRLAVKGLELLYILLPNLSEFSLGIEAAHALPVTWTYLAVTTAYAALYSSVLVLLATWSFARRTL